MKIDLYKLYKGFYQRSYRNEYDDDYAFMTELVHDLVRNLFRHQYNQSELERHRIEGIEISQRVYEIEKNKPGLGRLYSRDLIRALKQKNFEILVPYPVAHQWNENNYVGSLYVLTRKNYPGECKLGATYMDVETRVKKYIHKYGYSVDLYFCANNVMNPFNHELAISRKYSESRKAGNTYGDSNEWYYLDPKVLKEEILRICKG